MISLELDDEEVDVMRQILDAQHSQLLAENARVDTADFRRLIRHRLDLVEHLLARLARAQVATIAPVHHS